MKNFYSIKHHFENFVFCIIEYFGAAIIRSYNKSGTYGCLKTVHDFLSSAMFRSNILQ